MRVAFGTYEANLITEELWRSGYRVKLQSQPFKVLAALLEHPGELVTREELQTRLWGTNTAGDFEHALATAIKKIREALQDSAENPRFVETLARRGYRFIAPVSPVKEAPSPASVEPDIRLSVTMNLPEQPQEGRESSSPQAPIDVTAPETAVASSSWRIIYKVLAAALLLALAFGAGLRFRFTRFSPQPAVSHMEQLTHSGHFAVALDVTEHVSGAATDGFQVILPVLDRGHANVASVPVTGGAYALLNIPSEVAAPTLGDISPNGTRLLMRDHLSPESEQRLWVVPTGGGSAYRVGDVLAHDATFMPDGQRVLYASGHTLYVTGVGGDRPQEYATLTGPAFWLRWNPAGTLLRFTIIDPLSHTESLWQLSASDRKLVRLLDGFSNPDIECCGVWTSDGKNFIFQAQKSGNWDLWMLPANRTSNPERLTNGPLQFTTPATSPTSDAIYFLGVDSTSELFRLTSTRELVSERDFLSTATRLEYSRDKGRVAWVDQSGRLWCATAQGEKELQLTPDDLDVFLAHWSPDGSRLAIMARAPGQVWRIYLINATGGAPVPLLTAEHNAADPSWSPDAQSLVFGRTNDTFGKESGERALYILNLATGKVEKILGSDGLFSPRWSPDGKYIMALTLDQRQERLYTISAKSWQTLSERSGADPAWSSDSRYVYFHELLDPAHSIDRVSIPGGTLEQLTRLSDQTQGDPVDYTFAGLNPKDEPLILSRTTAANVYSLHLK